MHLVCPRLNWADCIEQLIKTLLERDYTNAVILALDREQRMFNARVYYLPGTVCQYIYIVKRLM